MALAPYIGLLLTREIDKYIDPVASERVHELDGVLHYRNPMPMCSARNGVKQNSVHGCSLLLWGAVHRPEFLDALGVVDLGGEHVTL